jgi:hypothetical protein
MRPVAVVAINELMDHALEVATAEGEDPVQPFTPGSADNALSEGVDPWGFGCCSL